MACSRSSVRASYQSVYPKFVGWFVINLKVQDQRRRSLVRSCQLDINTSFKAGTRMKLGPGPLHSLTLMLEAFLPCNPYFEYPLLPGEVDLLVAATLVY
jgi:hypothetical protein